MMMYVFFFGLEIMCDPLRIPNAEIVGGQRINYKIGSRIQYKCRPGFEPEQPVQITCDSQGQWTDIQQCTGMLQRDLFDTDKPICFFFCYS